MANEFIVKNGLISQGNVTVSGSISTTSPVNLSGFATGSVLFTSGSEGAITGSSNLFWDNTNGRLGVGTSAPTERLSVNGNISFTGAGYLISSTNNIMVGQDSAGNYLFAGENAANTPPRLFIGRMNTSIEFQTDVGQERMRIASGGNVLINTTTDAGFKLDVNGTARVKGTGATSSTTAFRVENTNASASLVVLDNGNVGIGNSNPSKKLHILGDVKIQTTTPQDSSGSSTIEFNPEFNTPVYIQAISNFGPTSPTAYSGGFKFIVQNRDASLANPYYSIDALAILANGNIGVNTITPTASLHVKGAGSGSITTAFRVENTNASASLVVLDNGNVGIGTTTPSASLHISGSSGSALLEIDSPAVNNILFVTGSGNVGIGTGNPLVSLDIRTSNNSVITPLSTVPNNATTLLVGNTETNGVLSLGQNNTGQSWIQGRSRLGDGSSFPILLNPLGGNILIGTTTDAGFKLDVNGTARVTGNASFNVGVIIGVGTSTAGMIPEGISGQESLVVRSGLVPSSTGTDITLTNGQGDVAITAGSRTMVSITRGFNPTSGTGVYNFFDIVATINQTGGASGVSRGLYVNPTLTSAANFRAIETTTGSVLFNGGNVGIGTTTPTSRLTVSGSAGTGSAIYAYKSGSTVLDIQGSQGQLFSVIDALSGSLMSVNDVSGLPILEVFSDDRVVMGTYGAPALTVSGSAVTVATASAAPTGTVPEGTFRFATVGGAYYIYAYLGGAWRSGSLF
jgi:hypothetical protein